MEKAQYWSADILISSFIFILILGVFAAIKWSINTNTSEDEDRLLRNALKFADDIMQPGMPQEWATMIDLATLCPNGEGTKRVERIGITDGWDTNTLNETKLLKLIEINKTSCGYSVLRTVFKCPYDFHIYAERDNKTILINGEEFNIGLAPISPRSSVKIDRIVVVNSTVSLLHITVWTNSTWLR